MYIAGGNFLQKPMSNTLWKNDRKKTPIPRNSAIAEETDLKN